MSRVLAVHLPAFRLERCGFGADDLAALIGESKGAVRIVSATPAARDEGVVTGITATEARALTPRIELVPWDEPEEAIDRVALCQRFEQFSDRVEALCDPAWDDALLIDLSWTPHSPAVAERAVAEGAIAEGGIAARAVELARALGHAARAAVADDPLAARALAEWVAPEGGAVVAPVGGSAEMLAPLPVRAVVTDPELIRTLLTLGIERLGQWARLDPASLAHRHGRHAARLQAVARGLSGPRRPPAVRVDGDVPIVQIALAGATTQQEIALVLPQALERLGAHLRDRDLAAARLRVALKMEEGRAAFQVRAGRPTRDPRMLQALVLARLERFRQGGGLEQGSPIEELAIEVVESAPDAGWQPGLADRTEGGEPVSDLVARLVDQLGEDAVFTPRLRAEWRPEEAWCAQPPRPNESPRGRRRLGYPPADPVFTQEAYERPERYPLPRPTLLLPEPERCDIEFFQSQSASVPVRVHSERGWIAITERRGPERLSGAWWSSRPFDREYWSVLAGGQWKWVFFDRATERWFLHGFFD